MSQQARALRSRDAVTCPPEAVLWGVAEDSPSGAVLQAYVGAVSEDDIVELEHPSRGTRNQVPFACALSLAGRFSVLDDIGARHGPATRDEERPFPDEARKALDELIALVKGQVEPSCQRIGHRLVASVAEMAEVRAVSVATFGRAFRITTVIDSYDPDVCEQVYERERLLYGSYPGLEAEFRVLTEGHARQLRALETTEYEFYWARPQRR